MREQGGPGSQVRRRHEREAPLEGDLSVPGYRQLRELQHGRTDQTLGVQGLIRPLRQQLQRSLQSNFWTVTGDVLSP